MGLSRKRIVVFLLAVAFCSGAVSLCAARGASDEGAGSLFNDSGFGYGNEPNNIAELNDDGRQAGPSTPASYRATSRTLCLM